MTATAAAAAGKIQPRLKAKYRADIVAALTTEFGYTNPHQVPRLVKVVVNTGVGEAARDSKVIDGAVRDLTQITGQTEAEAAAAADSVQGLNRFKAAIRSVLPCAAAASPTAAVL
jgi:ribosomal protein L5